MLNQITLVGKDLDDTGKIVDKPLTLNLEDKNGEFGTSISLKIW